MATECTKCHNSTRHKSKQDDGMSLCPEVVTMRDSRLVDHKERGGATVQRDRQEMLQEIVCCQLMVSHALGKI